MPGRQLANPTAVGDFDIAVSAADQATWRRGRGTWPRQEPSFTTTRYSPKSGVARLPGQREWASFDTETRRIYAELVLHGLNVWPDSDIEVQFSAPTDPVSAAWPSLRCVVPCHGGMDTADDAWRPGDGNPHVPRERLVAARGGDPRLRACSAGSASQARDAEGARPAQEDRRPLLGRTRRAPPTASRNSRLSRRTRRGCPSARPTRTPGATWTRSTGSRRCASSRLGMGGSRSSTCRRTASLCTSRSKTVSPRSGCSPKRRCSCSRSAIERSRTRVQQRLEAAGVTRLRPTATANVVVTADGVPAEQVPFRRTQRSRRALAADARARRLGVRRQRLPAR